MNILNSKRLGMVVLDLNLYLVRSDTELCVEDMWKKVRAHSARKMRPVENHLLQLKVSKTVASN